MSKNIILRTINEVKYFHRRILFAITLKEKVTFLILSNDIIFDIDSLKNYLIENELNHFAKNEIINLIELIDSFLNFKIQHEAIPKNENHFSYEYPTKGKGFGEGNLMYILKVNDQLIKTNEATFNEKEPLYSRLTSLRYFNISNRLLEIKDLFATFLEQPQQVEAVKPEKTLLEFKEFLNRYEKEALQVDLKKDRLVYEALELNKMKLNSVTFENEIDDVIEIFEKAVIDIKRMLHLAILNEHYKTEQPNGNPYFLIQMKCYFEYLELYHKAIDKKKQFQQPEAPQKNNEIEMYLKSYNQTHFDKVINKRNEDGTPNNIYLGNNFNEWLESINKTLYSNKSYDTETQDKLSTYNKYLCYLSNNLISLYKAISEFEKTKNTAFVTSIHLKQSEVLNNLKSIEYYTIIIKTFIRSKQIQKANDIREHCLALLENCIYNLNDVLTININLSPLNKAFKKIEKKLDTSINFENLKLIKDLSIQTEHSQQKVIIKPNEEFKTELWFKVGLLFATGEMDKLIIEFSSNATQIAKSLKNKNYRPYISESISKTNDNDKNIFSKFNKIKKIQNHCIENNIKMIDSFKDIKQAN